jgi:hypothetical protein
MVCYSGLLIEISSKNDKYMWYKESIYNLKHHLSTVEWNNFRLSVSVIKRYGNPKGHSRMDNQRHR